MVSLKKAMKTSDPQVSGGSGRSSPECSADRSSSSENQATDPAVDPGDFSTFSLCDDVVSRLQKRGIIHLFPVQYSTYRPIYKGKDVITQARTGSGKTLSFTLPIVSRLLKKYDGNKERGRPAKVIVLAPTRELAVQIYDDFASIADQSKLCIDRFYGGMMYEPQETAMRRGLDILVGTPGRILDLCEKGKLILNKVNHVILDEADRMLEIGFKEHMDKILAFCTTDNKPQVLLFSATMPRWVEEVASKYMTKPKKVNMIENSTNKTSVTVNHLAVRTGMNWEDRNSIIGDLLQQYSGKHGRAIIFTQTKVQANDLSVSNAINQDAQVLHGDIAQKQRELRLQGFRDGKFQCLVATDVAARGLDIPEVDLVVQCEPPKDVDSYIHRSGRTGRAGRSGTSVCLYNSRQEMALKEVEKRAGIKFDRVTPPQPTQLIEAAVADATRCLDEVPSQVIPAFAKYAKELLATRPAEDLLAAALSHISGLTEIKKRSFLSGMEGFTAYQMSNTFEVRSPYFFWNELESKLGATFRGDVKFMKLTKDRMGCVIDVPCKFEEFVDDTWVDCDKTKMFKMTELPELEDYDPRKRFGGQNSGYNNNRSGGYGNRSGGYNNNAGGQSSNYNNNGVGYSNNSGGYNTRPSNNNYNDNRSNNNWNSNDGRSSGGFKRRTDFDNGSSGAKRTKY